MGDGYVLEVTQRQVINTSTGNNKKYLTACNNKNASVYTIHVYLLPFEMERERGQ